MKRRFIAADVLSLVRFVLSLDGTDSRTANARRVARKIRQRYDSTKGQGSRRDSDAQ